MPIDIKYDSNINKNYIYLNGEPDPNDLKLIKSKSYARVKTNDEAAAKTSKTQKLGNKTDNDKNLLVIYKFILSQIKYAILFAALTKILFLQFVYFILIKLEQIKLHIQNNYQSETNDCNELKQKKKRVDSSSSLAAPSNVCVILNERIKSNDTLYETFSRIAEFLAANGARNLTFYSFDGEFQFFF